MLEKIKYWWGTRQIRGFLNAYGAWKHCGVCGDTMDVAVILESSYGYSIETGKLSRFQIVKACNQIALHGSNVGRRHDWFDRDIWYDRYTLQWLEENKNLPGAKRVIDAVKDQSEPQLPMW